MLLRKSISNTKKFFQKTIQNFKSFFSATDHYERIPKTPPYNPKSFNSVGVEMDIQASYKELDKFYNDFTNQWESEDGKPKKRSEKKNIIASSPMKQEKEVISGSFMKLTKSSPVKNDKDQIIPGRETHQYSKQKRQEDLDACSADTREERNWLLVEKLKELEMMDMSNVDHLLDIEEVLHYYSRLSCPAYVDIVDKFFMEIYAEFFSSSANPPTHHNISPRPKLRSDRL